MQRLLAFLLVLSPLAAPAQFLSQLQPSTNAVQDADIVPMTHAGQTYKVTALMLKTYMGGGSGGGGSGPSFVIGPEAQVVMLLNTTTQTLELTYPTNQAGGLITLDNNGGLDYPGSHLVAIGADGSIRYATGQNLVSGFAGPEVVYFPDGKVAWDLGSQYDRGGSLMTDVAHNFYAHNVPAGQAMISGGAASPVSGLTLSTVASSGSYTDLTNLPSIPAAQVDSDWNATSGLAQILNKPAIPPAITLTTTGSGAATYNPSIGALNIPTGGSGSSGVTTFNTRTGAVVLTAADINGLSGLTIPASELTGLATVATSGAYSDLSGKPSIPAAQVNSDWNATSGLAQILNKPTIPATITLTTSGTSGAATFNGSTLNVPNYGAGSSGVTTFNTRSGAVTLTAADINGLSGLTIPASELTGLATVATSGAYSDLTGKPSIPAAQVNSDWNASSGLAQILNKPTLGTAAAQNTSAFDASGAATAAQAYAIQRANQTGTQAASTVTGLATVATSGSYSDLTSKPTLGTAAAQNTTAFDASGAAAAAQSAAQTFSSNASNLTSGTLQLSLLSTLLSNANTFTKPQTASDLGTPTGPINVTIANCGDSRTIATSGAIGGISQQNSYGYPGMSSGYPANLQFSTFGYNADVFNCGVASTGVAWGNVIYANSGVPTTMNITSLTAGSASTSTTCAITGSTTGLTGTMTVDGPGIWPNTTATVSGTTATLTYVKGHGPWLTTSGATVNFTPQYTYNNTYFSGTPHQLSPAINTCVFSTSTTSGSNVLLLNNSANDWFITPGGKLSGSGIPSGTFVGPNPTNQSCMMVTSTGAPANATATSSTASVTYVPFGVVNYNYGINDTQTGISNCTMPASGGTTFTSVMSGSPNVWPVGTSIAGSGFAAGTTITSTGTLTSASTTVTYTTSNPWTGSAGTASITFTPSLSAIESYVSTWVTNAQADGWPQINLLTVWQAYGGNQATTAANTIRQGLNAWELATYGGGAVAGVSVIDTASLPCFQQNGAAYNYYGSNVWSGMGGDGLHQTPTGNTQVASLINSTLTSLYPQLMTGPPLYSTENQSIPYDHILQPIYNLTSTAAGAYGNSATFSQTYNSTTTVAMGNTGNSNVELQTVGNDFVLYENSGQNVHMTPTATGYNDVLVAARTINPATISGTGTVTWNQTGSVASDKSINIYVTALNGTATITPTVAFTTFEGFVAPLPSGLTSSITVGGNIVLTGSSYTGGANIVLQVAGY